MRTFAVSCVFALAVAAGAAYGEGNQVDTFNIGDKTLKIHFFGHSSIMLDYAGLAVYIDPVSQYLNFSAAPKADLILVTHEHGDHLDLSAIKKLEKDGTALAANGNGAMKIGNCKALGNGQSLSLAGIEIEAVPAYNTTKGREQYHPKGRDNGYILKFGDKKVYIAGDTEDIAEMANLHDIFIAFLPVNQPYTMTIEQAARAALMIKPKILYPYHTGDTDMEKLKKALSVAAEHTETRIRDMK